MGSLAYAQEGAAATGPGPLVQFLPLLLVFAVFYFLLIRPQQQKAKAHKVMLGNLKRNDEVVTAGGLYGKIVELGETDVRLEIASNVRVRIDRSRIETLLGGKARKDSKEGRDGKEKG